MEVGRIADSHSGFVNVLVNLACKYAFQGDAAQPSGQIWKKRIWYAFQRGCSPATGKKKQRTVGRWHCLTLLVFTIGLIQVNPLGVSLFWVGVAESLGEWLDQQ